MPNTDYQRVEKAIRYLDIHFKDQPSLKDVADAVGLSEYYCQRLFRRWAGISPKRFVQYLTAQYANELLKDSMNTLDVTYESGLSSPSRLHELFVNIHGMSPAQVKHNGAGTVVRYGIHSCIFGECLIGVTKQGICWLSFIEGGDTDDALHELRDAWPNAQLVAEPSQTGPLVRDIFAPGDMRRTFTLNVKGTNFQIRVWEALLRVPFGSQVAYRTLAGYAAHPQATRAVANAVARNPVAFLIPCHRVIRSTGAVGNYRWGVARKRAMLGWETAQAHGAM